MSTLLNYALTTEPFPLQASPDSGTPNTATLTVVGSNPNPTKPVLLIGISIKLPIGPDASDLTASAPSAPVPPDGWSLSQTKEGEGSVEYVFDSPPGQGTVGASGLAFNFNAVQINDQPGTVEVIVTEATEGNPRTQLSVTKFPNAWGQVSFWANPTYIQSGQATTLYWSGPSGATYTIEYPTPEGDVVNVPGPADPPLSSEGQYPSQTDSPLQLYQMTVFTLTVEETIDKQFYYAQQQVTVTVEEQTLTIKSFGSVPAYVSPNYPVTLSWKTTWASTWKIDPGEIEIPVTEPDSQGEQVQLGYTVNPTETTTYYLVAQDANSNQVSAPCPVTVDPYIVNVTLDYEYPGSTGPDGADGPDAVDDINDYLTGKVAPCGPGKQGHDGLPGPDLNVNISLFQGWLLQVDVMVGPNQTPTSTFHVTPPDSQVTPPAKLTLQSVGGTGGAGGRGGHGAPTQDLPFLNNHCADPGAPGGDGGPGGPAGNIIVNCPSSLKTQAQACLYFAATGGKGGAGGPGGAPGKGMLCQESTQGPSGSAGTNGRDGTVNWIFTD
jgi:hypothetical protein